VPGFHLDVTLLEDYWVRRSITFSCRRQLVTRCAKLSWGKRRTAGAMGGARRTTSLPTIEPLGL
jgi:hypothetical protein